MKKLAKSKFVTILIIIATVVLAGIAVFTAYRLYTLRQESVAPSAPTSKPKAAGCIEKCPDTDGILKNCSPPDGPESDNTPVESICNQAGRIEYCGGVQYCCPVANGTWTKDLSACTGTGTGSTECEALAFTLETDEPTDEPEDEETPTPTATATSAATATPGTATQTADLPESGTGWPTILGISLGTLVLIISLAIAL